MRTIDQIPSNRKVVLDIDLDYFSCSGNPNELEEIYVEITKDEYSNFINDKYHRLHFSGIGKIETLVKEDKYFYVINNYHEIYPQDEKVDEDILNKRIDLFIELLHQKNITPLVVNICRSRHSGYTPKDQWEFIEKNIVTGLKQLYFLKLENVI